jgi:hypothetical protein
VRGQIVRAHARERAPVAANRRAHGIDYQGLRHGGIFARRPYRV